MKVKSFTFKFPKSYLIVAFFMGSFGLNAQTNVFDDVIVPSADHSYLEDAILAAGLEGVLRTSPELTVFAPTNDAFDALAVALETDIPGLLALSNLSEILQYHVLGAEALSTSLSNGDIVQPLNNDNTLKVTIDGTDVFVNQAPVSGFDLTADNGVVHVLDAVVLPNTTVADIAIGSPAHTVLVDAVVAAHLLPSLTDPFAEFTVFAPTNDAFADALGELGLTAGELLASADLADILLYHVLGAEALSTSLSNGDIVQPLNNDNTLKVTIDGTDVFVNQAPVSGFDLTADNGVVHVLDAVVLPNTTVADIAIGSPAHTVLVDAVVAAHLLPALTDPFAEFTVFAPTNDAFADALSELGLTAGELLASADLADILLYHVLGAEALSTSLSNGDIVQPLNTDNTLKVTIDGTDVFVNQAPVSGFDLTADNGVVHVLDAVVLPNSTVADIAIGSPAHTTLVAAVVEARLLPALTDPFAEFTVFAPTNDAFADALSELGLTAGELLASADLADILLYHVLGAEALSTSLSNGDIVQPLNTDNTLKVTIDGTDVFVNQAPVSGFDLTADNGVVHVLDAVVLPNTTVADIAIGSPAHTTLVAAVVEARLLPALTDPFAELTVFAPTNDAFNNLATELDLTLAEILALPSLTDILLYHVVAGTVLSTDLENGTVPTLNGQSITVDITDGVLINTSVVTVPDLEADNGVVHVIDAVLVPGVFAGINEVAGNLNVTMYPNPATDNIRFDGVENGTFEVVNMYGSVVLSGELQNSEVSLSTIAEGTYVVRLINENGVFQGRLIKM